MNDPTCQLCASPILPGVPQSQHHLIPKLKGRKGGSTVLVHQVCRREVHASLTEAGLARDYNTPEALRDHPRLAKLAEGAAKCPPLFAQKYRVANADKTQDT